MSILRCRTNYLEAIIFPWQHCNACNIMSLTAVFTGTNFFGGGVVSQYRDGEPTCGGPCLHQTERSLRLLHAPPSFTVHPVTNHGCTTANSFHKISHYLSWMSICSWLPIAQQYQWVLVAKEFLMKVLRLHLVCNPKPHVACYLLMRYSW